MTQTRVEKMLIWVLSMVSLQALWPETEAEVFNITLVNSNIFPNST